MGQSGDLYEIGMLLCPTINLFSTRHLILLGMKHKSWNTSHFFITCCLEKDMTSFVIEDFLVPLYVCEVHIHSI